jgi:hypothetical protein
MQPHAPLVFQIPSFLHGTYDSVHRKALKEGRRCAGHYRTHGSFLPPGELMEVPPGEVVVTDAAVDLERERPAWRLYMVSRMKEELHKTLEGKEPFQVNDAYEESARATAWGALYFAISSGAPMDAGRVALRLEAVLRFWDLLQSARYLFSAPGAPLSLDELMMATREWAMRAWSPEEGGAVRTRLRVAAERMAHATREDCIEAILRQLPLALPFARGLKHREVLARPDFWRERLSTLDSESFARVSAAWPANLLQRAYLWDRQLGVQ